MSGSLTLEDGKAKVQGKSSIENCNCQSPRNFSTLQSFVRVLCSLQQWILFSCSYCEQIANTVRFEHWQANTSQILPYGPAHMMTMYKSVEDFTQCVLIQL